MHTNSWIEADGWMTDAYMFAVTYPEAKTPADAERLFMFSGSALHRADKVWFSSLAKLNFIAQTNGGVLDLQLNGQPRYHFGINLQKSVNSVKINGVKSSFAKENNLYTLKGKL
jgi:hypothetical protein